MRILLYSAGVIALVLSEQGLANENSNPTSINTTTNNNEGLNQSGADNSTVPSSAVENNKISSSNNIDKKDVSNNQVNSSLNNIKEDKKSSDKSSSNNINTSTDKNNSNKNFSSGDVYDVSLNGNWQFSAFVHTEQDNIYIPLKFIPSDVLGNITDNHFFTLGNSRYLEINTSNIVKKDDEALSLKINLTEDYFKSQSLDFKKEEKKYSRPINALYMNYDVNFSSTGFAQTKGTFDFNWASKDEWRLKNEMFADGKSVVRLNTTWQKQFKDNSLLVIGDTANNSLSGFNSLNFLGARYATPYFNNPSYQVGFTPTLPLSGFAVNPSKLDLYMNNQLVQQTEIASGKYNLTVPFQNVGYGVAQAYVYDITGKPTIVTVPFYNNSEIVKKGANEYDISGGFVRKNFGTDSFNYSDPVISALYKGGWANGYTQDLYFQGSAHYSVASALAHWVPFPQIGMLNLGISYNTEKQMLYRIGFERTTSTFSFGGDYQRSNNQFCFGFDQSCLKNQLQLYAGTPLPFKLGSLNLSYISRTNNEGKNNVAMVQWNKQLTKNVGMYANFSSITGSHTPNKTLYVGLTINLDHGFYASGSYNHDNSGSSYQGSIYRSEDDKHPEYGYGSVTYNKAEQSQSTNVFYGARFNSFAYQTNLYQDKSGFTGNLDVSGSVVYIPEANYVTLKRKIDTGLAYVQIENLTTPATVLHENRFSGKTDNQGRMLVPDAVPLNNETITVDINKLPKGITLDKYKENYNVPFSGATRIDFKSKPLPYVVKINGVPPGAIFNIGKDYYVVGDDGTTAVDSEGKATLPLINGKTCDLNISKKQKVYECVDSSVTPDTNTNNSSTNQEKELKKDNAKQSN